jgi:hypothetical protein
LAPGFLLFISFKENFILVKKIVGVTRLGNFRPLRFLSLWANLDKYPRLYWALVFREKICFSIGQNTALGNILAFFSKASGHPERRVHSV